LTVLFFSGCAFAESNKDTVLEIIKPFYSVFNPGVDATAVLNSITTPDWRSCGNNAVEPCLNVAGVVSSFIQGFGNAMVPGSITFEFKEIGLADDKVIVRGELSAIPKSLDQAPFFFCNPAHARFTIMTLDIHEIKHGLFASSFHLENFAGALGQIAAANPGCTFPVGPQAQCNLLTNTADFDGNTVAGTITFTQVDDSSMAITGNVTGLAANSVHGWHIHQFGINELLVTSNPHKMCADAGLHFNPFNVTHGDLDQGHVGDLGNLVANGAGVFTAALTAHLASVNAIVGRTLVIHALQDDLGIGNSSDSHTVGHSGVRLACCNIHFLNPAS